MPQTTTTTPTNLNFESLFLVRTLSNMQSLLDTLVASIVTNLVVTNVIVHVLDAKSESSRAYYTKLNTRAVLLDITSVLSLTLLAQRITGRNDRCVDQIVAAVVIQMVHDVTFGIYLDRMAPETQTMKLFREYANEHGKRILSVDATFMVVSVVLSRVLATLAPRDTMLLGTVALYAHLLFIDAL